jgi:hypothetical protein
MATLVLPSDRYQPRSHLHQEDPEWQAGYRAGRHERWLIAGASGGLLGYLIGRPHHPLVWASLMALVVISVVVALWPFVARRWPPKPRPTTPWPGIGPRSGRVQPTIHGLHRHEVGIANESRSGGECRGPVRGRAAPAGA